MSLHSAVKPANLLRHQVVNRIHTMRLHAADPTTLGRRLCFIVLAILMSGAADLAQAQNGSLEALRIVSFGTSLSARGGWQSPLASSLETCLDRPVEIIDHSRVGETSRWGLSEVEKVAKLDPDIVIIEFAINDAMITRWVLPWQSAGNLSAIVERLRAANPGIRLYLQEMNSAWGARAWARPLLDTYLASHRALAVKLGLGFIDHRPFWSHFSETELRTVIPDGVHPDPKLVADDIASTIARTLIADLGGDPDCTTAAPAD